LFPSFDFFGHVHNRIKGWDGQDNCKKAYIKAFIQIKKKEHDMTMWRHSKGALDAMWQFKGWVSRC